MILSAHAITGAALASAMPEHPLAGFAVGFFSHFVLDSIPHWDYHLDSSVEDETDHLNDDMVISPMFYRDLVKIAIDGTFGLVVSYFLFGFHAPYAVVAVLLGAIGGMAPDALRFVSMKWKHEPLNSLTRFHLWIHSNLKIKDLAFGVTFQTILLSIFVFAAKFLTE